MPRVREILRLHAEMGLSGRAIARSLGISPSTVTSVLGRVKAAGLSWPLPSEFDDDALLEARLFPSPSGRPTSIHEPDWSQIHKELRRKGVTLLLLWVEYKAAHPDGLQYSRFCERYRQWTKTLNLSMRQEHRAGEKMFVDYAGSTIGVVDRDTGEVRQAQVFVAVLGASGYAYAEAQWSQDLGSFIGGHVRAFEFFGGVPELVVPDNLKAGVRHADRYEPGLNRTYAEMASHYGCAVLPARPRRPKDKAKAEVSVLLVERWILAVLRKRTFFSLAEVNEAIRELLVKLNEKPFQKLEGSRKSLFETLDKPALRPLPPRPYEFAVWQTARVNIDYHIAVHGIYYSVPYTLVGQQLDVRITQNVVEAFYRGRRVASHARVFRKGQYVTEPLHRPKAHQAHAEWTPSKLIAWAESVGPSTGIFVTKLLESKRHPEQGYRACLGLLHLAKQYSNERLEAAALRAVTIGAISYRSVKSILDKGLDHLALPSSESQAPPAPTHENLRGAGYYSGASVTKSGLIH